MAHAEERSGPIARPVTVLPLAEAAAAVAPLADVHADEAERERVLPAPLLGALHEHGFFRRLLPRPLGGEWPHFCDWLHAVELLARADGSCGWCVNQGGVFATVAAWLEPSAAAELWTSPDTVIANGTPQQAQARREGDTFLVSGRWIFGSGSRHAALFAGFARVEEGEPEPRLFIMRREQVELVDNWAVNGMRATGSFDYTADEARVPARHSLLLGADRPDQPWPGYAIGLALLFGCSFGAVALGTSRRALDEAIHLARSRRARYSSTAARDDHHVHDQLGRAETRWGAARAYLHGSVGEIWGQLERDPRISIDQRIRLRMAGTHAMREARAVADLAANVAGADVVRAEHPVHRPWQDTLVAAQHMQARSAHYAFLGQHLLEPERTDFGPLV